MAVKATAAITLSTVVDVVATFRYYLLQSSTLNPPLKPAANPPTGSWTDAEPSYTSGSTNTLYFTDLTVFSDGTWSYSSVSRSSSYEAAKEAFNKAAAAEVAIDSLQIGGRNLLHNTGAVYEFVKSADDYYTLTDFAKTISADEPLFLSFDAYADVELYLDWYFNDGDTSYNARTTTDAFLLTTTKAHYTSPVLPSDLSIMNALRVRQSTSAHGGASKVGTVYLSNVKLEHGTKATDWTPAPEDVDASISEAVSTLEENIDFQLESVHAQISETSDSIRQEVQANYASAAGVTQLRQQVTSLSEQTENNFTWSVTQINQMRGDMETAQEATEEQLRLLQTYMSFDASGLIIGKTGNPFTFRVINDRLSFYMNETEVAYLSNNKLYVTQAEILTRLQIGKFAFEPQTNGNMSLIYTG